MKTYKTTDPIQSQQYIKNASEIISQAEQVLNQVKKARKHLKTKSVLVDKVNNTYYEIDANLPDSYAHKRYERYKKEKYKFQLKLF